MCLCWSFAFRSSSSSFHLLAQLSFASLCVCQGEFWWRSCFGRLAVKNVLVSVCLQTMQRSRQIRWLTAHTGSRTQGQHTHTDTHTGMRMPSGEFCLFFKPKGRRGGHSSSRDAFTRLWPSNFLKSNIFLLATTNLCCTEIRFITTVISPSIILTSIPTFDPYTLFLTHTPTPTP